MKRAILTGAVVALIALTNSTVVAQQSSSAAQVVTFGVARTAQLLVASFATLASARTAVPRLESRTLQRLATMPAKITFAAKESKSAGVQHVESSAAIGTSPGSSSPSSSPTMHAENVQTDLRTFLLEKASSCFGKTPVAVTITD